MKFSTFNQLPLYTNGFFVRHLDELAKKDALVIHNPTDALVTSPVFVKSRKSLDEHIQYVYDNNIRKAIVIAEDIQFLARCPSLEYLWVLPAIGATNFDYSPIYKLANIKWLKCYTTAGISEEQVTQIDYSQFNTIQKLYIHGYKGQINVALARNVVSLIFDFGYPNAKDIKNSFSGTVLRNFAVCQAPITSLTGIEDAVELRRLTLSYNRRLTDISRLQTLKDTLACLEIDTCGKISDFSVLETLHNLEFLILKGSNTLPNLSFIDGMPKLRYLHITMNVADGDLSRCHKVNYVKIHNRKHYSHKDQDLPKQYTNPDEVYPFNV